MSQGLCPSCGAAVNLTAGQSETKCQYCENVVTLQQAEAVFNEVKNSKFSGTLLIADTSREGGSYEEAIAYYNKVIEQDPTFAEAWLNKGICMVQSSKIGDLKTAEAISSWKAAIKFAKNPEAMKKRVAMEIEKSVSAFYPVLESHFKQFSTVDSSYAEHVTRFLKLENALALALELAPSNPDIATTGINLCEAVLSAATDAGTSNAAAALLNKDWKGAFSSAMGGMAQASAIKKPVEELKYKYQKALSRIDPNYTPPDSKGKEVDVSNADTLKMSLADLLRKPGGSFFGDLTSMGGSKGSFTLYPNTKSEPVRAKVSKALEFLGIQSSPDDCILFEEGKNFVLMIDCIGWGEKAVTVFKKVLTPEKKAVFHRSAIAEFTYNAVGYFKDAKAPEVTARNQFGVRQTEEIGSEFFKPQQYMYKSNHERPQSLLRLLEAWKNVNFSAS